MSTKKNRYSGEFKSKVALSAIREEGTLAELSSRWGVNHNMVSKWKKQAMESLAKIFSGKQERIERSNDEGIKELHAKIGQLTIERDFLEKASKVLNVGGGKRW
jgi:transposase